MRVAQCVSFQDRLNPPPATSSSSSNLVSTSSISANSHHAPGHNPASSNKSASFTDVATGVLLGGVLTQWNAGPDCWDWGMGWGWTSWNSAFCGTCAVEQAVLAHHGIGAQFAAVDAVGANMGGVGHGGGLGDFGGGSNSAQLYFDDDHESGELGDTDVSCDFGDFGF